MNLLEPSCKFLFYVSIRPEDRQTVRISSLKSSSSFSLFKLLTSCTEGIILIVLCLLCLYIKYADTRNEFFLSPILFRDVLIVNPSMLHEDVNSVFIDTYHSEEKEYFI